VVAVNGISASAIDAAVKTAKPALYMRTRPKMSTMRPKVTTSTAVTNMYPLQQPQEVADVGRLQGIEVDVPVTVTPQFTSMSISPDGPRPPAPYRPVESASRGAGPGTAMC